MAGWQGIRRLLLQGERGEDGAAAAPSAAGRGGGHCQPEAAPTSERTQAARDGSDRRPTRKRVGADANARNPCSPAAAAAPLPAVKATARSRPKRRADGGAGGLEGGAAAAAAAFLHSIKP